MSTKIIKELHPLEKRLLEAEAFKLKDELSIEELIDSTGLSGAQIRRAAGWLKTKGLVDFIPKGLRLLLS